MHLGSLLVVPPQDTKKDKKPVKMASGGDPLVSAQVQQPNASDLRGPSGIGTGTTGMVHDQTMPHMNTSSSPNVADQINPINYLGDLGDSLFGLTQNKFQAGSAPIQQTTNAAQLNNAYGQTQSGIAQQQAFTNALLAQNGIGNQANVFGQMQGVANGTGPNPAQAQLAQATGANVANQAALMAGQRGAGANAGMIARQAAQQGAGTQQQAAGQAATLQAQQSLNALGQMGGIAQNQINQQGQAITGYNTAAQNQQNALLGAAGNLNSANVGMQSNMNNVNGQISQGNQSAMNGALGGVMNSIGSVASMFAEGGEIEADAGTPGDKAQVQQEQQVQSAPSNGPQSAIGQFLNGSVGTANLGGSGGYTSGSSVGAPQIGQMGTSPDEGAALSGGIMGGGKKGGGGGGGMGGMMAMMAQGGQVDALVSPGERYLDPNDVQKVAQGANPIAVSEKIPGKPKHPGNDYRNDVIPKTLEEGGIVIPNAILQGKNPHWEAMRFVHATMAKNRHKKK